MANGRAYPEHMALRFKRGWFTKIDAVLKPGENRSDFVRAAVETEVEKRKTRRIGDRRILENFQDTRKA